LLRRQGQPVKEVNAMNWTQILKTEMESAYSTTAKLLDKVDPSTFNWKPATGTNWMTVGQLLKHITEACGLGCRAFVTNDWGLPPGKTWADFAPEEIMPPAEKMPTIQSMEQVRDELAKDRALALRMVDQAGENDLANRPVAAPWAPAKETTLGFQLLNMIQHLERHKAQLFYYLKLQGKPVNTMDLWGEL
jgi:uncharacterized damage-inducible protein DinB